MSGEPVTIDHVADFTHRYPGEDLAFHTCLRAPDGTAGLRVVVSLPEGLALQEIAPLDGARVREEDGGLEVEWRLDESALPGERHEWALKTRVGPAEYERALASRARLLDADGQEIASETARVRVNTRSSYMAYLPEIYHENDFLNRLLMLFESFWKPIEGQVSQPDVYFDPSLTPEEFLPWMASWVGISWDENLPAGRKRALLGSAVGLYQSRGTRQALIDTLSLYSGGRVEIIEHRAQNFILGRSASLGRTIALGTSNLPHSFIVRVQVGRDELGDQPNSEKHYRQRLEAMIAAHKPAHTTFELQLQVAGSETYPQKGSDHGQ